MPMASINLLTFANKEFSLSASVSFLSSADLSADLIEKNFALGTAGSSTIDT